MSVTESILSDLDRLHKLILDTVVQADHRQQMLHCLGLIMGEVITGKVIGSLKRERPAGEWYPEFDTCHYYTLYRHLKDPAQMLIVQRSNGNWGVLMPGDIQPTGNFATPADAERLANMNGNTFDIKHLPYPGTTYFTPTGLIHLTHDQ